MPNNFKKMSKVEFTYEMRDQLGDLSDQLNKIGSNCKWYEELKPIAQPIIDSQFSFNNIIPEDVEENEYNKAIKDLSKLKDLFSAKNIRTIYGRFYFRFNALVQARALCLFLSGLSMSL